MYLAMASTVEAQTAEEAKSLSKTKSCDRKPVKYLQMPASRNLAVYTNINQFQRLMRGHVYLRRVCYARLLTSTIGLFIRVQFIVPFRVPVLQRRRNTLNKVGGGGGGGGGGGRAAGAESHNFINFHRTWKSCHSIITVFGENG